MAILVGICCLLIYYFHWVLRIEVVFSHFFYVPIILAAVWWKKRGLVVPLFLALLLLQTPAFALQFESVAIRNMTSYKKFEGLSQNAVVIKLRETRVKYLDRF